MTIFQDKPITLEKYLIDLDKFTVVTKISSGDFGNVYLIQDQDTKKKFAAKTLQIEKNGEQINKIINREIGIMIRLQHPTIIHFQGFALQDFNGQKNVTIIMEYALKGSLETLLKNVRKGLGDISYDNTVRQKILIGIAYGMKYLHQHHIIHGHLKPGNILLDDFYHPHITDFFFSKTCVNSHSHSKEQTNSTSIYMAPEVINGDKYDEKADVYSFAILMYEVITNAKPYPLFQNNEMSLSNFNEQVVQNNFRPEFTEPIKDSLKKLIIQCWSENPFKRPTFQEIFNKLALNNNSKKNDESSYYLDCIDEDEVSSYVYKITENELKSPENMISKLKKEN